MPVWVWGKPHLKASFPVVLRDLPQTMRPLP